ncbi:hypothetical protein [Bacteroides faecium]|uniref:Lipoprotein n=1 Tax=Bacteroides faecium TaxID=2715212 RepID=A0A6H0KM06_9BACE|nr:hypothetical protein [Bacteroides faecium]QIU94476.1 hypothetical protein BacF7301_10120 [Bacteroides faecium]
MKENNLYFIVLILFSIGACSNTYRAKPYGGLRGKVSSIRDTVYHLEDDSTCKIHSVRGNDFDSCGNLIRTYLYSEKGECKYDNKYTYTNGIPTYIIRKTGKSGQDSIVEKMIKKRGNKLTYRIGTGENTYIKKVKRQEKYESRKCLYKKRFFDREEYWYDENDNIIQYKHTDNIDCTCRDSAVADNIAVRFWYKSSYDDNNDLTEDSIYSADSGSFTKSIYVYPKYDMRGNWIEQQSGEYDTRNEQPYDRNTFHFDFIIKRTITYAE